MESSWYHDIFYAFVIFSAFLLFILSPLKPLFFINVCHIEQQTLVHVWKFGFKMASNVPTLAFIFTSAIIMFKELSLEWDENLL